MFVAYLSIGDGGVLFFVGLHNRSSQSPCLCNVDRNLIKTRFYLNRSMRRRRVILQAHRMNAVVLIISVTDHIM